MSKEFRVLICESLLKSGLLGTTEIYTTTQTSSFGNSESIWEFGNLRIRFIKDKSQIFVDIGSLFDQSHFFIFDDIALFMKWQKLDEIIKANTPLDLLVALDFVKGDLNILQKLFSKNKLKTTSRLLDEISRKKTQARFGK